MTCVVVLACFYKTKNQNSYNVHKDEEEEQDKNVAHQPDSSTKKKQDKKQMGFSNPIFTDIDENMLDTCSKTDQSLNGVKSVDLLDVKVFRGKDKHDIFTEIQVEPNDYVDYRSLSSD